jgi:hypothetical protein
VDPSGLIESHPAMPEPGPLIDSEEWPSIAAIASEAPYRVPTQINFKRLTAITSARLSDTKDHIRALREDPGYLPNSSKNGRTIG